MYIYVCITKSINSDLSRLCTSYSSVAFPPVLNAVLCGVNDASPYIHIYIHIPTYTYIYIHTYIDIDISICIHIMI